MTLPWAVAWATRGKHRASEQHCERCAERRTYLDGVQHRIDLTVEVYQRPDRERQKYAMPLCAAEADDASLWASVGCVSECVLFCMEVRPGDC